jgi:hypothetical protein
MDQLKTGIISLSNRDSDISAISDIFISSRAEYSVLAGGIDFSVNSKFIKGLLQNHNASNFSKLSSVISITDTDINIIASVGDDYVFERIFKKISENVVKIDSSEVNTQDGILFTYSKQIFDIEIIIFAVSGSKYFNRDIFDSYASAVISVYDAILPVIPDTIGHSGNKLLDKIISASGSYIDLLKIENIEPIFMPSDINNFFKIEEYFINMIMDIYNEDIIEYHRISLSRFLIIKKTGAAGSQFRKLSVNYQGTNIVCAIKTCSIENDLESIRNFILYFD